MTGLLSAISGQFSKAWILGALFPSAIFVFLFVVFVAPLLPPGAALAAPPLFGTDWNALSITFATLVLSALLYSLDTQLIQVYEGYGWQGSLLGRWRTRVEQRRLRTLQRRAGLSFALLRASTPDADRINAVQSDVARTLPQELPDDESVVLPTRLGNVLRASELYPTSQYGMDAISLWPRLVAVIPADYATAIGSARTSLVFLLTLSFLTMVLGVVTLAVGLVYLPPDPLAHVALPVAGFLLASVWLHRRSFDAASDWGQYVKGAFDLFRGALLENLGYQQKPATRAEELALWDRISNQVIFGDERVDGETSRPWVDYSDLAPPAAPAVAVRGTPEDVALELTRAVDGPAWLRELRIVVAVRNTDPARDAADVVVTDTLPDGMAYRWGSARVDGAPAAVEGTGPYRFRLGKVAAGATATLTYTACATHFGQGS